MPIDKINTKSTTVAQDSPMSTESIKINLFESVGNVLSKGYSLDDYTANLEKTDKVTLLDRKSAFEQYGDWAGRTIQSWMEELFADLVAVRLLGPAYTLAYVELLQLIMKLHEKETRTFQIDHPADALRLREQVKVLRGDGWEPEIEDLPQWKKLDKIAKVDPAEYLPPSVPGEATEMEEVWKKLISYFCLDKVMDKVHSLANKQTRDREPPFKYFKSSAPQIRQCLRHGIVPSVPAIGGRMPHPTAIINGAVFFLLSGMDELYKIVPSMKKEKVKDRALLEQRVEMWCMKAIEDWLIRRR